MSLAGVLACLASGSCTSSQAVPLQSARLGQERQLGTSANIFALPWSSMPKAAAVLQVCKVYLGSFNADKPIRTDLNPAGAELFAKEQSDLLNDLYEIPQRSCDRKVNPA